MKQLRDTGSGQVCLSQLNAYIRHNLQWIAPYLNRDGLTDIYINKPGEIILEGDAGTEIISDPKLTLRNLTAMGRALATTSKQFFDEQHPSLSCALPAFGCRVQINGYDNVESGFAMSIRIGQNLCFPLESYVSDAVAEQLRKAVQEKKNILLSGATGSGKTTLANSLIRCIPVHERVLALEDPVELLIEHANQVRFTISRHGAGLSNTNFTKIAFDLLRHNPSRFIFGELEAHNIFPFLKMLNSGHGGTLSTLHANSPTEALEKIVMLGSGVEMEGQAYSPEYVRSQTHGIDVIIQITKLAAIDGKAVRKVDVDFRSKNRG